MFILSSLGNKYISQLTADGLTVLRIELEDHTGYKGYAEYSNFTVTDVTDNYRIHVSGYTGSAGINTSPNSTAYSTTVIAKIKEMPRFQYMIYHSTSQ